MSESKHTPGPWEIRDVGYPKDNELWICKFQNVIAKVSITRIDEQAEANARLIAAAPALLEALRRAYFLLETKHIKDEYFNILRMRLGSLLPSQVVDQKLIEAAIKKAEKEG